MNPNKLRRLTAAALLLSFTLPQAATAAAPTTETDEAVYIIWTTTACPKQRASSRA